MAPCTRHCCWHARLSADQLCPAQAQPRWSAAAGEPVLFSRAPGAKELSCRDVLELQDKARAHCHPATNKSSMPSHPAKTCFPVAWSISLQELWQLRGLTALALGLVEFGLWMFCNDTMTVIPTAFHPPNSFTSFGGSFISMTIHRQ